MAKCTQIWKNCNGDSYITSVSVDHKEVENDIENESKNELNVFNVILMNRE